MTNYIKLTKKEFEDIIPKFVNITHTTNAKEYVYESVTNEINIGIRIYSSVDTTTNETRGKGNDAIRIVLWDLLNNKPLMKSKRIHRTEGTTTIKERVQNRITELHNEAKNKKVIDFKYIEFILNKFQDKPFAESLYNQVKEKGSLSEKQLSYVIDNNHPNGYKTFEQQLQSKIDVQKEYENFLVLSKNNANIIDPLINIKDNFHKDTENKKTSYCPLIDLKDNVELVSTKGYPYKFDYFNPVQSLVYPHREKDCNMIISANTSAGKTICAEILMDETLKKDERIIYLSPLKSLTQEKYEDWQKRYPDENITILTGDYILSEKTKKELTKSRIIVMTSEMMDSRTRKYQSEKNFWLHQVGLTIVDESHILTTSRGHAVETGIMRFTDINPNSKIIFLSATMPNVNELGEWLTTLNNKRTEVIYNTWRPVKLNVNYIEYEIEFTSWGQKDYWANQNKKQEIVVETVLNKPDEKFLIFVHDKTTGYKLIRLLADEDITAKFHSADLKINERLEIEKSFEDRENGLRVLISTSTLAWGRNLPARNVIITGIHRGIKEVDSLDILQMSGRAGRYGIDNEGFVNLIIPEGETKRWEYIFKNPRPVMSVLNNKHILAFHSLAEIQIKKVKCQKTLLQWYSRSLAFLQENKKEINSISENNITFTIKDAENLCDELTKMKMIDNNFNTTGLGNTSAWLYYSPYDIYDWYNNFDYVFKNKIINDYTLSWAIADIDSNISFVSKQAQDVCNTCKSKIYQSGVNNIRYETIMSILAAYNAISGESNTNINPLTRTFRYDINRIISALKMINDKYANWEYKNFDSLGIRFKYGVGEEIVELCKIEGVGAVRAQKIYEKGIKTINDVAKTQSKEKLLLVLTPPMVKKIQNNARKLL